MSYFLLMLRKHLRQLSRDALVAVFLSLLFASAADAAYWIDATKQPTLNCGTSAANACPDYAHLMGTTGCPGTCGCDSNGCADNISNTAAPVAVHFVSGGTWNGDGTNHPICYNFSRSSSTEVSFDCADTNGNYRPQQCTVTGANIVAPFGISNLANHGGIVVAGAQINGCSDSNASYVQWKGINLTPKQNLIAWHGKGTGSHLLVRDTIMDGSDPAATNQLVIYGVGTTYVSFINNVFRNCPPSGGHGCVEANVGHNAAVVGNTIGPDKNFKAQGTVNRDGINWQDSQRVLIDGNKVFQIPDCIDIGSQSGAVQPKDYIIRYNDVSDCTQGNGVDGNAIMISGDSPSGVDGGPMILYKNVVRYSTVSNYNGGPRFKERSRDIDQWYQTVFSPWHNSGDSSYGTMSISGGGPNSNNMSIYYGIFDGSDAIDTTNNCTGGTGSTCPMGFFPGSGGTASCSSTGSTKCAMIGNGIWYAERGASAPCLHYKMSDTGSVTFNCDLTRRGGGSSLNSTGANTGNFRADPHFENRATAGASLANLKLTASSTNYLNVGDSFCHATASGSGNTIDVTCGGASTDPRHYFPSPSDYYAVSNGDCAGAGTRAAEANGSAIGCFDFQIEGCAGNGGLGNLAAVRTVTSMTATSITFAGPSCSWVSGAMIHIPWNGSRPDVGALEYQSTSVSQQPPAPTGLTIIP